MKEKLAVVLFAKSFDAFNFACNHNGILGEEFKVKFMGTQAQAIVSTALAVPPTATTTSPKELLTINTPSPVVPTPTKAEKAAAAAKAAALLADQAVAYAAAAATVVDVDTEDVDVDSFQGITGDKHRDSKILLMSVAKGSGAAVEDVEGDADDGVFTDLCHCP